MNYRLDPIALSCKDLNDSVSYYEKYFGGKPTALRKGGDGRNFCFVDISGAAAIQLIESPSQVAVDLRAKGAEIIREVRDTVGKLTTLFVKDSKGLRMEVRLPR